MRTLLLMRHAKSDWNTSVADFDRPLSRRGELDAPAMGKWMARHDYRPDWVVSSPARRAKDTATAVCRVIFGQETEIGWDPRIYEASLPDLLGVVAETPSSAAMAMIIGHNPGLEYLLAHLVGDTVPGNVGNKLLPTAALACLDVPGEWADLRDGGAAWRAYMRPKDLA